MTGKPKNKLLLRIYDKLIVAVLFSSLLLASCDEPDPVPEYGAVPVYGVIPSAIVDKTDSIC